MKKLNSGQYIKDLKAQQDKKERQKAYELHSDVLRENAQQIVQIVKQLGGLDKEDLDTPRHKGILTTLDELERRGKRTFPLVLRPEVFD